MTFDRDYEAHRVAVYRYALKVAGSREDAEDVTQESLLRLQNALGRSGAPAEPRAWLFRVATNLCLDLRRRRRTRGHEVPTDADRMPVPPNQVTKLLGDERRALAQRTLARLGERDRILLVLWAGGHGHAEMARITGLRRSSIGRLLERATRRALALANEERRP